MIHNRIRYFNKYITNPLLRTRVNYREMSISRGGRRSSTSAISRLFFNLDFCRDPLKQGSILSSFMGIL